MKQRVGIVGTGRVARALGSLLNRCGVPAFAIAGRSPGVTEQSRLFTGAAHSLSIAEIPRVCSHVLVAVSDDAIPEVMQSLTGCQIALHVSGAAGLVRVNGVATGVLHPLQTIPDAKTGIASLPGCFFGYGGDAPAEAWALDLIGILGGKALRIAPDRWGQYHAAATMASNFQVTLIDAALELMTLASIAPEDALRALEPLVRASVDNTFAAGPAAALTGPVKRGDAGTLATHRTALRLASKETRRLYLAAALRTLPIAERAGLPSTGVTRLRAILEAETV